MTDRKEYKVSQIDGKITWQVEELWVNGAIRGPYGTKEAAIAAEQRFAEQGGFTDSLILTGAVGRTVDLSRAFVKDESGAWTCTQACSIEIDNKEIAVTEGLMFMPGNPFMGVDVAGWLDNNVRG